MIVFIALHTHGDGGSSFFKSFTCVIFPGEILLVLLFDVAEGRALFDLVAQHCLVKGIHSTFMCNKAFY